MKEQEIEALWAQEVGDKSPVDPIFRLGCLAASARHKSANEMVVKSYDEQKKILELLTVAGFITEEKIEQARELAQGLKP